MASFFRSEVTRHGHGGGEAAGFEGAGGVEAFVLDVDVGIFAAGQHGGEAFAERDGIGVGKDGVVAPHGGRASGEMRGREGALDVGEIVAGVEDSGVFGADGLRAVGGIVLTAAGAFEVRQHAVSLAETRRAVLSRCSFVAGGLVFADRLRLQSVIFVFRGDGGFEAPDAFAQASA